MECFFGLTLGFVGFCFDMDLNFVEAQFCVGIPGFEFCRGGSGHLDSFRRFVATKFGAQVGHGIHKGITYIHIHIHSWRICIYIYIYLEYIYIYTWNMYIYIYMWLHCWNIMGI